MYPLDNYSERYRGALPYKISEFYSTVLATAYWRFRFLVQYKTMKFSNSLTFRLKILFHKIFIFKFL